MISTPVPNIRVIAIQNPPASPVRPASRSPWCAAADDFVEEIYRQGFVQSLIIHVALLLVLALVVIQPATPVARLRLDIGFSGHAQPSVDLDDVPILLAEVDDADAADAAAMPDTMPATAAEVVDIANIESDDFGGDDAMQALAAVFDATDMMADVPAAVRVARRRPAPVRGPGGGMDIGPGGGMDNGMGGVGIGGEIGRRLRSAGARTGDVQVSIAWNNFNDIDLHVMVEAAGPVRGVSQINFFNRRGACGGWLDVDQNVTPWTPAAVENVFWAHNHAPYGKYTVAVHHFRNWGGANPTEVEVVMLVDGKQSRFITLVQAGQPPRVVTSFLRQRGQEAWQQATAAK